MQRVILAGIAALGLTAGGAAQQPSQESKSTEPRTVTGCLKAGTNPGEFVLAVGDRTPYQIKASADVELVPHENHRVEITGTVDDTTTGPVLNATAVKMVSTSCESP